MRFGRVRSLAAGTLQLAAGGLVVVAAATVNAGLAWLAGSLVVLTAGLVLELTAARSHDDGSDSSGS